MNLLRRLCTHLNITYAGIIKRNTRLPTNNAKTWSRWHHSGEGGGWNTWKLCEVNKRLTSSLMEKEEQPASWGQKVNWRWNFSLLLTGDLAHSQSAFTSAPVTLSESVLNQNASPLTASHSASNYTVGVAMQNEREIQIDNIRSCDQEEETRWSSLAW